MDAAQAIQELCDDPVTFLRHNFLVIVGGGPNEPSGPATFKMEEKEGFEIKGFTTGLSGVFGVKKQRGAWKAIKQKVYDPAPTASDQFNAEYVRMALLTESTDIHYTLPAAQGLNLMLTGQLTGCSFGVGSDAFGARIVSHVKPDKNATQTYFDDFVTNGLTDGVVALFKNGSSYSHRVHQVAIVGHRTDAGATWNIYAQKTDGRGKAVTGSAFMVEAVEQLT